MVRLGQFQIRERARDLDPDSASRAKEKAPFPGLFEADEETRTLDLLHGKQTL
jgi:hypothetical protein